MVKRNGTIFSREPGNLMNKHSYKYSGIAPAKTISIQSGSKGIVVKTKTKNSKKPSKSLNTSTIYKPARSTSKAVRGIVKGYRPDLVQTAIARAGRILQSQAPVKPKMRKTRK
jgi:large subunit ribosomal protein L28e